MQLQLFNCITSAGLKPTLKNSSGTKRYYIDLQSNIISHQLNYYWSDKVLDISYLYFWGLWRMNVNLLNACICISSEELSTLTVFTAFERPKGLAIQLRLLDDTVTCLHRETKAMQLNSLLWQNLLRSLLVTKNVYWSLMSFESIAGYVLFQRKDDLIKLNWIVGT